MSRILIFDDEEDILEIMEIVLGNDHEIFTNTTLKDPIKITKEIEPDLILLDLRIPPIGGEKAVQLLKSNNATKTVKIFLFSADNEIERLAENCGADGYFIKPFKVNQLREFVKEQLI